jgi:hypothetical protein
VNFSRFLVPLWQEGLFYVWSGGFPPKILSEKAKESKRWQKPLKPLKPLELLKPSLDSKKQNFGEIFSTVPMNLDLVYCTLLMATHG